MKLFSQRNGLKEVKNTIQIASMNVELRNGLTNVFTMHITPLMKANIWEIDAFGNSEKIQLFNYILTRICDEFFKKDIGEITSIDQALIDINTFIKKEDWDRVYDLWEFLTICLNNFDTRLAEQTKLNFIDATNKVLERENAGYRFISNQITPITDLTQIEEIEKVLESPLQSVTTHFNAALSLLSDRKNPDYRNSIKESISGIEAVSVKIVGKKEADTLGKALKLLETKGIKLHQDLLEGFKKLYHYTSDGDGIRHGLQTESTLEQEDALYMLVTCAAFVNYLFAKCERAKIKL